jgi:hypothetical protein
MSPTVASARAAAAGNAHSAAREREREVDLLCGDRADEHLERRGRQRRPHAVQRLDQRRQDGIGFRHPVEARQIEVEAEEPPHFRHHRAADPGGARTGHVDGEPHVVDGPAPPDLVRHERIAPTQHTTEHVALEDVHRILAPQAIPTQRSAHVERAVGSQTDPHRRVTRAVSVPPGPGDGAGPPGATVSA